MPRVITNFCLRDGSCTEICPVDCISPGEPVSKYPTFYIDPDACIDCGACETECPNSAIFDLEKIPDAYHAEGGEILTAALGTPGFEEEYDGEDHNREPVHILATRTLDTGEVVNLTNAIEMNIAFYIDGPGYTTQK